MNNILVVEDEKNISVLIKDTLSIGKYNCCCVFDGITALETIKNTQFDLIILDIMLPGIDGFQILEQIKDLSIPIIFLSAKKDTESIVKGLTNGAQDYIVKPFEPLELLARVDLRLNNIEKYTYKNISIYPSKREVFKEDKKIALAPKEYELFLLLLKNLDKIVTRKKILKEIWNINVELETRTIDYHIQQLRKKLNLKDSIITINKIGYRLEK